MDIKKYIFDQDGTLYTKNSPLWLNLSEKTKEWVIEITWMNEVEFNDFVLNNPDFVLWLQKIWTWLIDWHQAVQFRIIEQINKLLWVNINLSWILKWLPESYLVTFSSREFSEKVIETLLLDDYFQWKYYINTGTKESAYKEILWSENPSRVLVIWDNLGADLLPAVKLWMQTMLIDPNKDICSQIFFN